MVDVKPYLLTSWFWPCVIGFVSLFILLPFLSLSPVFQNSEAREGQVVQEILRTHEFILPLRQGEIVPSKPILFHWVGAIVGLIAGDYGVFELRLPSALAAALCLIVVFRIAVEFSGTAGGVLAAALLLCTTSFYQLGSDGRVDMLFMMLVTAAIGEWLIGAARSLRSSKDILEAGCPVYVRVGLLAGLSMLAKGPLGPLLVVLVIASLAISEEGLRGAAKLLRFEWLLILIVALPWYIIAAAKAPASFIQRQIIFENVTRFFGGAGIDSKPSWFYLPFLLTHSLPLGLPFFIYIFMLGRDEYRRRKEHRLTNRFMPPDRTSRFGVRSMLIWIGVMLLFLTLSAGKRRAYLLLIMPAMAVAIAIRLASTWSIFRAEGRDQLLRHVLNYEVCSWGTLIWLIGILFPAGVFYLGSGPGVPFGESFPETSMYIRAVYAAVEPKTITVFTVYSVLALSSLGCWIAAYLKKNIVFAAAALFLFVQFVFAIYFSVGQAGKGVMHSPVQFAKRVNALVPEDAKLYVVKKWREETFDSLLFYLDRDVRIQDEASFPVARGVYIAQRAWIQKQRADNRARIEELAKSRPERWTKDEELVLFIVNKESSWIKF